MDHYNCLHAGRHSSKKEKFELPGMPRFEMSGMSSQPCLYKNSEAYLEPS